MNKHKDVEHFKKITSDKKKRSYSKEEKTTERQIDLKWNYQAIINNENKWHREYNSEQKYQE